MAAAKRNIPKGVIIAILWSLLYFPWLMAFLRANWNFDPRLSVHWLYLRFQWLHGWVISTPREWVFIFTVCLAVPIFILGFLGLYSIPYKAWFAAIAAFPGLLFSGKLFAQKKKQKSSSSQPEIRGKKRGSHRQTRPPALRPSSGSLPDVAKQPASETQRETPLSEIPQPGGALVSNKSAQQPQQRQNPFSPDAGNSRGGSSTTNISSRTASKPILETPEETSIKETLERADYEVIEKQKIGQNMFSYVGIGPQSVMICLIDDTKGDWLADEEMFGSEPPLWFSESSHKTSPAYVVLRTAEHLKSVYNTMPETRHIDVYAFLIFCEGKIINADDMMEVWRKRSVSVCRAHNGQPDTLPELEPILPENDRGPLTPELREKIIEGFDKMTVKI